MPDFSLKIKDYFKFLTQQKNLIFEGISARMPVNRKDFS